MSWLVVLTMKRVSWSRRYSKVSTSSKGQCFQLPSAGNSADMLGVNAQLYLLMARVSARGSVRGAGSDQEYGAGLEKGAILPLPTMANKSAKKLKQTNDQALQRLLLGTLISIVNHCEAAAFSL